ncbi:hypothetical protein NL676_030517 [Syzygium grande]|nr:hypothetical protein NL676_030517 [Syzygium grande]
MVCSHDDHRLGGVIDPKKDPTGLGSDRYGDLLYLVVLASRLELRQAAVEIMYILRNFLRSKNLSTTDLLHHRDHLLAWHENRIKAENGSWFHALMHAQPCATAFSGLREIAAGPDNTLI